MSLILPTFDKRIKPPLGTPLNPHLPINKGLVGFWPMNEGGGNIVRDVSGNSFHGTNSGAVWVAGSNGPSLYFGGSAYVDCGSAFGNLGTSDFTVICRLRAYKDNQGRAYLSKGQTSSGDFLLYKHDQDKIRIYADAGNFFIDPAKSLWTEGQWLTVSVIRRGAYAAMYYNQAFVGEDTSAAVSLTCPHKWIIGASEDGTARGHVGDIDCIYVYSRALTPNEIASLYADPWQGFRRPVIEWWGAVLDAPSGTDYSFTINDGMGIGDDMGGAAAMLRGLSEAMGLGDDVSRAAAIQRAMSEAMGLTDTAARVATVLRALADSVGLTDETIEGAARQLVETINDAVGLTDAQSRLSVLVRAVADSLGMADAATTLAVLLRTISDAQGMTDGQTLARMIAVADDLGVSDEMGRIVAYLRGQSDSVGLSDTTTRLHAAVRQITDTEGLTDSYSTAWTVLRTIADTLGLTDAMIQEGTGALVRVINDVLGMVDAKTKLHAALRVLASTINTADSVSRLFAVSRVISDAEGITDGAYLGKVFTFAETIGISDEVTRLVAFLRTQDDTVGVLEAILKVSNVIRSLDDAIEMTDAEQHSLSGLVQAALAFLFLKKGR